MSRTVCIFAGARGKDYLYPDAEYIGRTLAKRDWHVIYGGSSKGLMGSVCRGVKAEGGQITGVLPKKIHDLKHFDPEIGMLVADTMAQRKQHFWDRSDAFLCLPGGYGTLDELGEILTLTKLGYYPKKPIVVYNQGSFYNGLIDLFQQMVQHGCMEQDRAGLVKFTNNAFEACNLVTGGL